MPYLPIEKYGVIGNLRTAALVGMNGSIDWLCLPRFDSPSVFGAILDDAKGGRFRIAPTLEQLRHKQFYWPDTNVLVTRFLHPDGIAELEDYMPVGGDPQSSGQADQLIRRVRAVRGHMTLRMECTPAFDYARAAATIHLTDHGACFEGAGLTIGLSSSVPLKRCDGGVTAEFDVHEGDEAVFVLRILESGCAPCPCPRTGEAHERFLETVHYWQKWISKCTYRGRWRESVQRSALALKLMTYEPTGAIVAAPTTSLPEGVGGTRNWDYRYTWIRDAAFTVYGLLRIGFTEEAVRFMDWLRDRYREPGDGNGPLHILYRVDGSIDLHEEVLSHLDGYAGSKPVRIGNGAADQLQLDIYGELMDSAYLFNKYAAPLGFDAWVSLRKLVDWVADNWQRIDQGVWEVRGEPRQFVFSKFMCWVAMDRGLRLAQKRSFPADHIRWLKVRDEIYEDVMRHGWSKTRQAFTQAYGSDALDASALLMPLTFFTAANDPRMLKTIDAIRQPLHKGGLAADGLVYRYRVDEADDGMTEEEGTFNMCSFWLVEALTRAGQTNPRYLDEARLLFERITGYANHLGLYAEQTGLSGEALGNFPQAFTHLAHISAAFNLDRALGSR
ncbi:glycoside hydrolase family 15 protein [Planctomyces sp. SH-PL14]|uniref:glycoside hydrolase family 15 protein n=1 Tax=Planctomyces sp. SH-PL14 TaxID=1632864 RepID=UPI00078E770B|nr:glycoside hydrolase family 15 protein [Planctomyces sp. SH-PL14]AMV22028.1 Trehalase [Planctomyces sp. SH-PL14]